MAWFSKEKKGDRHIFQIYGTKEIDNSQLLLDVYYGERKIKDMKELDDLLLILLSEE